MKFFKNLWKEIAPLKRNSSTDFPTGFDLRTKEERDKAIKHSAQANIFSALKRVADILTKGPNFYDTYSQSPYPKKWTKSAVKYGLIAMSLTTAAIASSETVKRLDAGVLADEARLASMANTNFIDHRLLGLSIMPAERYAVVVTKSAEGKCSLVNAVRLVVDNGAVYPAANDFTDPFFPNNRVQKIKECAPFEPATLIPLYNTRGLKS